MMSCHQHIHPPRFFGAKWIRFRRLCLYRPTVQSQWVDSRRGDWRCLQSLQL